MQQEINEDTIRNAETNRYLDSLYAESDGGQCYKCKAHYVTADLTFCAAPACENEICCDCRTELQAELEVCSDSCGATVVESLRAQLAAFRKPATGAPARRMVA